MNKVGVKKVASSFRLLAAVALIALILLGVGISPTLAQSAENRAINLAQQAVRNQIINQGGGRIQIVRFNNDAQIRSNSNSQFLVTGTGAISQNNARNNNSRNNEERSREFSYEATVNTRYRNSTVTDIKYDWRGGWSGNGRYNNRGGNGVYGVQSIYCASDDGRRHTCPVNINGATVRLVNQRSGSSCVEGRTWGFNNTGIWVDRGCRADFEVDGGREYGADGRDNRGDRGGNRVQSIYCASDDGRRHTCPVNINGAAVRLVNQRSGSSCVEGRTWGFNNTGIWVDRGCRADFEVDGGREYGADGRDNRDARGVPPRPNGRIIHSGPIINRHSDKGLDVTEQGMLDGANIQQWSYADQPNQNWDIIDVGNNEVAIISRHSGRAITVQGGRDISGTNIIQRAWSGTRQQRWRLEPTGDDYYRIVSVDNGKCLDVTERGRQDGANIQLWDNANQANQQWRFKR